MRQSIQIYADSVLWYKGQSAFDEWCVVKEILPSSVYDKFILRSLYWKHLNFLLRWLVIYAFIQIWHESISSFVIEIRITLQRSFLNQFFLIGSYTISLVTFWINSPVCKRAIFALMSVDGVILATEPSPIKILVIKTHC